MACTSPSYGSYVSAVNKNTLPSLKDANRWQQQPPHLTSHPPSPFTPPPPGPPGHFSHTLTSQKQHSNQHNTVTSSNKPHPHAHGSSSNNGSNSTTNLTTPTGISNNGNTSSQSSDSRNYGSNPTVFPPSPSLENQQQHSNNPYHRQRSGISEATSPSKGAPFPGGATGRQGMGHRQDSDGGWSQGLPTKGSGWSRGSKTNFSSGGGGSGSSSLQSPRVGPGGWNGMSDTGTSGWGASSNSNSSGRTERRSSSSGSGWLSSGDGRIASTPASTPSVDGGDGGGWDSSSGQPASLGGGGGRGLWGQCEVIDEDMSMDSGSSSATLTSMPSTSGEGKVGGKRENGKHPGGLPRSMSWGEAQQQNQQQNQQHFPLPGGSGDRKSQVKVIGGGGGGSQELPAGIRIGGDEGVYGSRADDRQTSQQQQLGELPLGMGSSQGEDLPLPPQLVGRPSSKFDTNASRMDWDELDRASISSSEREVFGNGNFSNGGNSQENHGPSLAITSGGSGGYPPFHPDALPLGGHPNEQGKQQQQQLPPAGSRSALGNSQESHVSGSDDCESLGGRHVSPRNGAGTPIQGRHSGSATPTQGRGSGTKIDGGGSGLDGSGTNCWQGRKLNLDGGGSSIGTGWKVGGNGTGSNYHQSRSSSPRKPSRYERSSSTSSVIPVLSYHDSTTTTNDTTTTPGMTSAHTPSSGNSTPSSNTSSMGGGAAKIRSKTKKGVEHLGEGLDTLHHEPSGWGELPSPKDTDRDNGTEFWGIPPEDVKRQKEKAARVAHQTSHPGDMHRTGWSDGNDWEEEAPPTGWYGHRDPGGHGITPGTPGSAMVGGPMGYNDARGLTPSTPRSMLEPPGGGGNSWGSFNHKNKKLVMEKHLKPASGDFDMGNMFPSPEELAGPSSAASTPAGDGSLYMKDRLPHSSKIPTTLNIGSSFDLSGSGPSGLGIPQDGGALHPLTPSTVSSSTQSQAQRLQWLQLQQQYLFQQVQLSGGVPMPSLPLNLQNFQQVLTQHLAHFQKQYQQLMQQAKLASSMGGGGGISSTQHHQINLKLKQTQQGIQQINNQLSVIAQLSSSSTTPGGLQQQQQQPKAPSPKSQELGSFGSAQMHQGTGMKHPGRSHSTSSMMALDDGHDKSLMFGVQGLSLGGSNSGGYGASGASQNGRSASRLHQIISGSSSSNESLVGGGGSQGSMSSGGGSQGSSPFSPPLAGGGSSMSSYSNNGSDISAAPLAGFNSAAGTPSNSAPSPFLSAGKFGEIQEFKPGVPWQPRNQSSDQPGGGQHLPSKHSMPGGRMGDTYNQTQGSYGASSPVVDLGTGGAGMGYSSRPFQGGNGGGGMPHKYIRSNSTGSGLYRGAPGNSGGGGGFGNGGSGSGFGKKQVVSPVVVSKYYGSGANQRSDRGSGWGNMMTQDSSSATSPFGNAGHSQMSSYYQGRSGNQGSAQSPMNVMTQSSGTSWKQQQQQQQISAPNMGSRRMAPPSSLPPRAPGSGYSSSKSIGGTPIGGNSSFYGGSSLLSSSSSASSFSSEDKKWGGSGGGGYPSTPSINTPSSSMLSSSIWGSSGRSSSDEPLSISSHRNRWGSTSGGGGGNDDSSNGWGDLEGLDGSVSNTGTAPTRPPGFSMKRGESTSSASSAFDPPLSAAGTVLDGQECPTTSPSSVTTPSFASGSNTWGQAEPHKEVFSPEPSFAEWQAGKKARLSVSKPPSNMATSPWLVMHNVSNQVSQNSVEEACSEFGELKVCYIHQPSEFCLLCYSSVEEASQAKATLDKNPAINGVHVTVDFASESGIKDICEQLQVRLDLDKQQQQQDEAEGPKHHQSWGFTPSSQPSPAVSQSTKPSLQPSLSSSSSSSNQWGQTGVSAQNPSSSTVAAALPGTSSLENSGNPGSNSTSGNTGSLFNRQSSELSTPGSSSVWSDPGFLSGFSSPWQSGFSSSGAVSGGSGINSGSFSLTSPQQGSADAAASSFPSNNTTNNASGEPFLPNGLF